MRTGERWIDGRLFYLAGRGAREDLERQKAALKREWRWVRILPYGWGQFGKVLDDFGIWVCEHRSSG